MLCHTTQKPRTLNPTTHITTTMNDPKKEAAEAQETEESQETSGQESNQELDLDSLDLSVEAVDERISPSETNVFDK